MIDRKTKHYLSKMWLLGVCVVLLLYFLFHLFSGDHGFFAWRRLEKELMINRAILQTLENERKKLDNQVNLMKPDRIDRDMLDERVRTMLGAGNDKETVILNSPSS